MDTTAKKPANIDEYIATFPKATQDLLEQMRGTVQKAAPGATELISYQIPAFKIGRVVVFFAGYRNHIGFYPTPSGIHPFEEELSVYKQGKGSVQFPQTNPCP